MRFNIIAAIAVFLVCYSKMLSQSTDWYLQPASAVDNPASWNSAPNGSGSAATSFTTGNGDMWHISVSASLASSWALVSTETVIIETGADFTVATGGFINQFAIEIAANGTLTIGENNSYNFIDNLDPASLVRIITSSYSLESTTSAAGGNVNYGNVRVSASTGIAGSNNADTYINGLLTLDAGVTFSLNGNYISLLGSNGSIAGSGAFYSDNQCIITIAGGNGGDNGTINFAPNGNHMLVFFVQYNTGSDIIRLGSDIFIENGGLFEQHAGLVDLNGHSLSVDATSDATFPTTSTDGGLIGDPASSVTLLGTLGKVISQTDITLFLDASDRRLKSLNLATNSNTFIMGTDLTIIDSLSILDGAFDMGSNLLTLKANNASKARIGQMGTNATFNGSVSIETFISGGSTGWMNIGTPGVSGSGVTFSQWDTWATNGQVSGIPMTCTGCFYAPWGGTFTSIQDWVETTSTYSALSSSTQLENGKGYWVYVGDGSTTTNDLLLITSGSYTQSASNPPSIPLTASGSGTNAGWNLVCNPYASPISWTKLYALNSNTLIDGQAHAWSPDNLDYGDITQGTVGATGTNGFGDIIPAGQGFMVKTASVTTLNFDESVKDDSNINRNLTKSAASANDDVRIRISGSYGEKNETIIRFKSGATPFFDHPYDADKLFKTAGYAGTGATYSKYTTISSRDAQGRDYSINTLPPLTKDIVVPILVRVMYAGTFSISAENFENVSTCLVLYDKLLNKYQDLKKSAYSFTISDSTSVPRFELHLCQTEAGQITSTNDLRDTQNILIGNDGQGPFVSSQFSKPTTAVISVYNIIGQQLCPDITTSDATSFTRLPVRIPGQVIIVRVRTADQIVTKKVVAE